MPDPPPSSRPRPEPSTERRDGPLLVLDTASPVVSVAIGDASAILAEATMKLRRSSEKLLDTVDEVLEEAGARLDELGGVAVVRGPGSFTGLRVGLATALGWHQALGLPVTGLDAHRLLAFAALRRGAKPATGTVSAVVDALRGEWSAQRFYLDDGGDASLPEAMGERRLVKTADLVEAGGTIIGFGVEGLIEAANEATAGGGDPAEVLAAGPLAPTALAAASDFSWDPGLVVQPIYFRAPAVSVSKKDPPPPPLDGAAADS